MPPRAFPWPEAAASHPRGVTLRVRLTPRAAHDDIGKVSDGRLAVRVTAPPVDGKANQALLRLLAGKIGCPPSGLEVLRGNSARLKTVLVLGAALAESPDPKKR